jgi:hypothetical protein
MKLQLIGIWFMIGTIIIPGCFSGKLNGLVPASGTVTLNGSPVEGATVSFSPQPGQERCRSAVATTKANGKFSLMTLEPGDGVSPGTYLVSIEKTQTTGEIRYEGTSARNQKIFDTQQTFDLLPPQYRDVTTSGLTVTISAKGDKNIQFDLTGEVDHHPRKKR